MHLLETYLTRSFGQTVNLCCYILTPVSLWLLKLFPWRKGLQNRGLGEVSWRRRQWGNRRVRPLAEIIRRCCDDISLGEMLWGSCDWLFKNKMEEIMYLLETSHIFSAISFGRTVNLCRYILTPVSLRLSELYRWRRCFKTEVLVKSADGGGGGVPDEDDPWLRSSGAVAMTAAWERCFGTAVTGFSSTAVESDTRVSAAFWRARSSSALRGGVFLTFSESWKLLAAAWGSLEVIVAEGGANLGLGAAAGACKTAAGAAAAGRSLMPSSLRRRISVSSCLLGCSCWSFCSLFGTGTRGQLLSRAADAWKPFWMATAAGSCWILAAAGLGGEAGLFLRLLSKRMVFRTDSLAVKVA